MVYQRKILESLDLGNGVAERERQTLKDFFYETREWKKLRDGKIDLIFGPKGSGKSSLFFSLLDHEYELLGENIVLVSSENLVGASVFDALKRTPPETEDEYVAIWKIYILVLIVDQFSKNNSVEKELEIVEKFLTQEGIYKKGRSISGFLASVAHYVKSRLNFDSIETEMSIDPNSGMVDGLKGRMTFSEPSESERERGYVSINDAVLACNKFLIDRGESIWVLIDRLDVIFANDKIAERLALRALFRVYGDFYATKAICLKIFLRDDIWREITEKEGFREASHFVNKVSIKWDKISLVSMLLQRFMTSTVFNDHYRVKKTFLQETTKTKIDLLNTLFPRQLNIFGGTRFEKAVDWLIIQTMDGKDISTPRDLVELINFAKEYEIDRLDRGDKPYNDAKLMFNLEGLAHGAKELSRLKMEQTIFAEHPELREYINAFFDSLPRNFDLEMLMALWGLEKTETIAIAARLTDIGFLKPTGKYRYLIPILFTNYLGINPSNKKFTR